MITPYMYINGLSVDAFFIILLDGLGTKVYALISIYIYTIYKKISLFELDFYVIQKYSH